MVQGDRLTDTIPISSVDGTMADLVITINGVGGDPGGSDTNVAVIIDTDPGDTGELRYALDGDGPLAAGRVELKIKRLDDDLSAMVMPLSRCSIRPPTTTVQFSTSASGMTVSA